MSSVKLVTGFCSSAILQNSEANQLVLHIKVVSKGLSKKQQTFAKWFKSQSSLVFFHTWKKIEENGGGELHSQRFLGAMISKWEGTGEGRGK